MAKNGDLLRVFSGKHVSLGSESMDLLFEGLSIPAQMAGPT